MKKNIADKKKYICFGAGYYGKKALEYLGKDKVVFFADNNKSLIGKFVSGIEVISFGQMVEKKESFHIVISVDIDKINELSSQLDAAGVEEYTNYFELCNLCSDSNNIDVYKLKLENERLKLQIEYLIKHINLKDLKPARGYLRRQQRDLMDYVAEVLDILETINITPFLIGGNLIGWIRHKGFVPWDDDVDFGIIRKDYEKLLAFAKRNFVVMYFDGDDSELQAWIDTTTVENSDKYILYIYSEHIQISRGSNCLNRMCVDFFLYDYYADDYSFEEHNNFVKSISEKLKICTTEQERLKLTTNAIKQEKKTVEHSTHLYFGMDSCEPYLRTYNTSWIDENTIFPLQKIVYEGKICYIPNKPEAFIKYEYRDFMKLPKDFGYQTHDYWIDYKLRNLITIEFYLVDSFEISHFAPLYFFFRKKGLYARFVAENQNVNTVGKWFDYDKAIDLLEEGEYEYATKCNPDADFAFTTQRSNVLLKYRGKKINIVYGCGLPKGQFAFSKDAIEGFDYKFVHGEFTKELCMRNYKEEKKLEINFPKIMLMGYPKFNYNETMLLNKCSVENHLDICTSKKILLYLPTWGESSSIQLFRSDIQTLRKEYYILTKPHHCTIRIESELEDYLALRTDSDRILDFNYNINELLSIADIVVCNAESGVSLEVCWLKKDVNLIMVTKRDLAEFYDEIEGVAPIANKEGELTEMIFTNKYEFIDKDARGRFVDRVFGIKDVNYLEQLYLDVFNKQ